MSPQVNKKNVKIQNCKTIKFQKYLIVLILKGSLGWPGRPCILNFGVFTNFVHFGETENS